MVVGGDSPTVVLISLQQTLLRSLCCFSHPNPNLRLDGCYQRHGRESNIMYIVLMIANTSGIMQETKMGMSVSGK